MLKRLLTSILLMGSGIFLYAQQSILNAEDNGTNLNVLYRNEASAKLYANTRGYGLLFRKGKHVTSKTNSYYEINIQNLRHPKEIKVQGDARDRKRFVYGKLNNVLLLQGGIGLQNILFSKADIKAVEIRYSYSIGPTFAFAKPYYVQVNLGKSNTATVLPASRKFNTDSSLDSVKVTGRGAFTDGLSEMKIYPGISGKFNLSFEYAPYTNLIRAIETGVSVDYYPKALPIMAKNPAENVMVTLYVGFVFGRKWY